MKAFSISRYKKESPSKLTNLPEPSIKDHEVLVEIHAASVNLLDSKIKSGEFKLILPYKMPLVLGHDVAGIVVKTGAKVKNFKVGDEIYSRPADFQIGTFAEFIAIHEKDVALKPENLTMEEAASIPLVGLTGWQALVERSKVQKGQNVFIQAGSGGVGTFAIQLAKHLGATVATTASKKSFDFLKSLGADVLIDYKTQDFEDVLIDYDVVLNSQDNKTLEKSFHVVKPGGKIVSISGPPTPAFAEDQNLPWYVRLATGFLSRKIRRTAEKQHVSYSFLFMKANGAQLAEITGLIEAGKIKPVIDKVFPFHQTNDAVAYVESGRAKGKVVIKMK
ncbi:NADP-dependent oxidoreductase [Chryseobacterium gregarium]|uniref:NADP-dependent oxidoreductase n=1 Tax=Chryseobacterium gregarium TaxID=456299 RepID=UPI0004036F8E|nr:NADP-dependent oxidoreductase [Chryseobacterium gregarium]